MLVLLNQSIRRMSLTVKGRKYMYMEGMPVTKICSQPYTYLWSLLCENRPYKCPGWKKRQRETCIEKSRRIYAAERKPVDASTTGAKRRAPHSAGAGGMPDKHSAGERRAGKGYLRGGL